MPRAQRVQPLHRQIYDWFTERIAEGAPGFAPGDKLPPVRETARTWAVGYQAAQHAYELLASAKLVESQGKLGTFVSQPRNILGPQQRLHSPRVPAAERIDVRAAGLIPAPAYIRPILDLPAAVSHVIRREWVTSDSTGPFMLNVSWVPPRYAEAVPELLQASPLPDGLTAAYLIAARYLGHALDWGRSSREARAALDDGREAPLLGLGPDGCVLAEVYVWGAGERVVEYGEFVVRQNRVVESDMEP
jgi:DNA-binding GntR family transcriptional regulator